MYKEIKWNMRLLIGIKISNLTNDFIRRSWICMIKIQILYYSSTLFMLKSYAKVVQKRILYINIYLLKYSYLYLIYHQFDSILRIKDITIKRKEIAEWRFWYLLLSQILLYKEIVKWTAKSKNWLEINHEDKIELRYPVDAQLLYGVCCIFQFLYLFFEILWMKHNHLVLNINYNKYNGINF